MGADLYMHASHYAELAGLAIEIGSSRESQSTQHLNAVFGDKFLSVDIENKPEIRALLNGRFIHADGTHFLRTVTVPIAFGYLDNFDWRYSWFRAVEFQEQIDRYANLGRELNNLNSQAAHLNQAIEVEKRAAASCVIMIDDTWRNDDTTFNGKGGCAVPYLVSRGFQIVAEHSQIEKPKHSGVTLLRC